MTADSDVEHARYSVVAASDDIEIRDYPAQIIAETIVSGERAAAISEGFRRLAGYIFGANQPNEKIAMTAPVEMSWPGERADAAPAAVGREPEAMAFLYGKAGIGTAGARGRTVPSRLVTWPERSAHTGAGRITSARSVRADR